MNKFQERFNELLFENNFSRLQLAKQLGVSSTTINGYFNDNYYPQIDIAIKIANFFDCSLDYLFGLSEDEKKYDANTNSFFTNFQNLLKDRKIPIAKALREMKMSEYNYYRWQEGMFPKTNKILEIAKYFEVSIDFLVGKIK